VEGLNVSTRCPKPEIEWNKVDGRLDGLSDLFSKGRRITLPMESVYKEVTEEPKTAKGKKKKQTSTDAQKAQLAADAGLWSRLYKNHRCRAKC
jgi:hypothetical protein